MTSASNVRGPGGVAAGPPADIAERELPISLSAAGTTFHRIHRRQFDPIFFGPGAGNPPTYRFDSARGAFGVLYVGLSLEAAMVETLLRSPNRRLVSLDDILARSHARIIANRPLRLVPLHGPALQILGADNAISTGPYGPCGAWADALHDHPDRPDGLVWRSRHDPDELCAALFERCGPALRVEDAIPLERSLAKVAAVLDRYGKSIVPGSP